MLRLRQAQLQQNIQLAQEQLNRIEARLNYIERGSLEVMPEVVLKTVRPMPVIASYTKVSGFMLNMEFANGFLAMLRQYRVKEDGCTHYLYHPNPAQDTGCDVEVAIPVEGSLKAVPGSLQTQQVVVRELPEVPRMASIVHRGSPYTIIAGYQALGTSIQNNGYTISGPGRKVCLRWEGSLDDYLTEIQFPVELQ